MFIRQKYILPQLKFSLMFNCPGHNLTVGFTQYATGGPYKTIRGSMYW